MRISDWSSDVCSSDLGPDPTSIGSVDFGFAYDAGIDLRKIKVGYSPAWFGSVDFGSTRDATGHDLNGLVPANPGHLAGLEAMRASGVEMVERSEEHTSELQSLMRISYAVFCLKKKTRT